MPQRAWSSTSAVGVLALLAASVAVAVSAVAAVNDTIGILKDGDDGPSNVEVAVRLAEETFPGPVDTVLIGRDDVFADSLASGALQTDSPLLLVPPAGPIPARVRAELALLDPDRVLLLGGPQALGAAVEAELAQDYDVQRRAGPTRFETAIDIAGTDLPDAGTAILARAFAANDAEDPTQAFADALAAGGLAARNRWPILLTQTEVLTGSTRDYLTGSGITDVMVVGGTAAISDAVLAEVGALVGDVQRVAGATRFETALAIAEKTGERSAADAARVILVDGEDPDGWAGGFAAAAHAAQFDGPIVLARADGLPAVTQEWLAGAAGFAVDPNDPSSFPILTCVLVQVSTCQQTRETLGLPPAAVVTFDPPDGATVQPGQSVSATVDGPELPTRVDLTSDCVAGGTSSGMVITVTIAAGAAGSCTLTYALVFANGTVQTETVTYTVGDAPIVLDAASAPAGGSVTGSVTQPNTGAGLFVQGCGFLDQPVYATAAGFFAVDFAASHATGGCQLRFALRQPGQPDRTATFPFTVTAGTRPSTDAPELVSAFVDTAGVVTYAFDENVTGFPPAAASFMAYGADGTRLVASSVQASGNVVSAQFPPGIGAATVATLADRAVADAGGTPSYPSAEPLSGSTSPTGVTVRPELVSVEASTAGDGAGIVSYVFDAPLPAGYVPSQEDFQLIDAAGVQFNPTTPGTLMQATGAPPNVVFFRDAFTAAQTAAAVAGSVEATCCFGQPDPPFAEGDAAVTQL